MSDPNNPEVALSGEPPDGKTYPVLSPEEGAAATDMALTLTGNDPAWVTIQDADGNQANVRRDAFDEVWAEKGFTIVETPTEQ